MGRKIPLPKRHFGITDPLKQREEREAKIKDKINNPPKDVSQQEVSKKFKSFLKLKESVNSVKIKERVKTVDDDFRTTKIDLEGLKKNENETDHKFMKRVSRLTHQRRMEAGFAAKYNVDIIRNQDTGEIKLKKKPKDEIDELMKKRQTEARNGKRKFVDKDEEVVEVEPKLSSLQKLKMKKQAKKEAQKEEKSNAFAEYHHDIFKFGETVHAPPTLVTPRKAKKDETVPRPGKRDLLLTSMLKGKDATVADSKPNPIFKAPGVKTKIAKGPIDKKGKRKNLPNSIRLALETESQNAVELYRQLKKKKPLVPIPNKNLEDF